MMLADERREWLARLVGEVWERCPDDPTVQQVVAILRRHGVAASYQETILAARQAGLTIRRDASRPCALHLAKLCGE
jgi:TorA maturation chaperone TorD